MELVLSDGVAYIFVEGGPVEVAFDQITLGALANGGGARRHLLSSLGPGFTAGFATLQEG